MRAIAMGVLLGLAAAPSVAAEAPLALPGWMAGAWEQAGTDGRWADEYWTPPRGTMMLGVARIGRDNAPAMFEYTRIVQKADGMISFFAQPRGAPAAEFPMVAYGPAMIEFANAAHDYPQRIRYWREDGRLKARISLIDGSKAHDWDYGPMDGS